MKIAITGGTGFVGRNVARQLVAAGHEVVLVARGRNQTDSAIHQLARTRFVPMNLDNVAELARAFAGCEAVVHGAGINREIDGQTYQRVHVDGSRNVIEAARRAGCRKIVVISFLRARPDCGSGYHESKWAAEELARQSGLDYTVLKCGVIYGQGDHMLNHLSHAFYTFPVFAFVGFRQQQIRPNAVADVARIVQASLSEARLSRKTVAVMGPETLTLRQAVRRVARVAGRRPIMFPMPVWFHRALGRVLERTMRVPMVSTAQVQMLVEGLAEPCGACDPMPADLAPKIVFSEEQICLGLPAPGAFGWRDFRFGRADGEARTHHRHGAFFEIP